MVAPERWDTTTDPDRFTFREAVAHLADWEPIHLFRMQKAIDQPGGPVHGLDESQRALEMEYDTTDPVEQAHLYLEHREEIVRWLECLPREDWRKTVVHSEKGEQTLEDQASMLVCHDTYHIEHLLGFVR